MNRKQNKYKQTTKRRTMKLGITYINAKQNVGDLNEEIESTRHMAFGRVLKSFGALTANAEITPITK